MPYVNSLTDLRAPAKLNLFLRVVGRRRDGYHLLQSLFVLLDWHDTLHLECRPDGRLQRHDRTRALPPDDLCLKAARLLQQRSGCSLGVDIHIEKVLPSGAGLGGGSSDAATVLLGLNRLWGLNWSRPALMALGAELGADVPFFIGGTNALVQGIGELLTPIRLRPRHYVVVKPPVEVLTQTIFSDPALPRNSESAIVEGFLADPSIVEAMMDGEGAEMQAVNRLNGKRFVACNDLQGVAVVHAPEIGEAVSWLKAHWGNGQMTGSGSAAFARETAANGPLMATVQGQQLINCRPGHWEGRLCRSLEHHPLADGAGC